MAASEQPPRVPPEEPEPGRLRDAPVDVARHPHRDGGGRRRAVGGRLGVLNAALIVNPRRASLSRRTNTTRGWRVEGGAPDARVGHPLRHAVFEAVDAAAARDLEVHGPDAPPLHARRRAEVGEKRRRETITRDQFDGDHGTAVPVHGVRRVLRAGAVRDVRMALVHSRVRRVV